MSPRRYLWIAAGIGASGVAFSGYLSAIRWTSGICALNDPCPFFLGYPACYAGFALFVASFLPTVTALAARIQGRWPIYVNLAIGAAGMIFSGRLALIELVAPVHPAYAMGLPTCAYGFVFFTATLGLAAVARLRHLHTPVRLEHQLAG